MAGEISMMFTGRLTADPELGVTANGKAYVDLSIVHSARVKQGDKYEDGDPWFFRSRVWARFDNDSWPSNIAASLGKGAQVVVQGRARREEWTARDGRQGETFRLELDDIGPSLQWVTAQIVKPERRAADSSGGQAQQDWGAGQQSFGDGWAAQ